MVDALRRAHRMVAEGGLVVDVHPTVNPARLVVDGNIVGSVSAGDAPVRHAAADAKLAHVIDAGFFHVDAVVTFDFSTHGDTVEELRDYVVGHWRNARIDDGTVQRARTALDAGAPGIRPQVVEQVRLTTLRPLCW